MRTALFHLVLLLTGLLSITPGQAQMRTPYRTAAYVDGPIIGGLLLTNAIAFRRAQQDQGLTDGEVGALNPQNVNRFDRFSAGYYNEDMKKASDYIFYGSLAAPLGLVIADEDIRRKAGQVGVLYVETMATTGAFFTVAIATVERSRPLAYNTSLTLSQRGNNNSTNSFFAGHTALVATNTFFVAKVFRDFYPESPARPFVWAAAATIPAAVGYMRLKAGKHFLSDNLIGYAVGAASGILIPELHRKRRLGVSVTPVQGLNANGYAYGGLLLSKQL